MPTWPLAWMWPGMMPILHSLGRDDAGAVGADEPRLRTRQRALHRHHVEHRDALGDAHDERQPGVDRLEDRVGGEGRRHVDHGRVGAGGLDRLGDGVEDRQVEMLASRPCPA